MGVTGLWTVVQPCARPIKIETLNKKRLAIDASIWIYQFLKAVRDKEGNALRNSHVVGFFRRICKLLFIGIKPVFVFDGGAPLLKRETIGRRKARREGRREDAVRTAGKLLGVQMKRRAEEEERKRREEMEQGRRLSDDEQEEMVPENLVYVEELQMTPQERMRNRRFKKTDAYHLPELDVSLAEMGAPNDPRVMSHEELEEYARQFHMGEDVNIYDFSKIDFNSPFFMSLPASDRYNILNAARLRSRLRMGYSKEQLDTMFPDRMAFSRFQVERVKERNELTQRLMNINGMNGEDGMFGVNGVGKVAGEKGKEYVLVKNDGVEGGWALGVVSNKNEGQEDRPIDLEQDARDIATQEDGGDDWEDDSFEDVPIEGLNRLPKAPPRIPVLGKKYESERVLDQRQALYKARKEAAGVKSLEGPTSTDDADSLFVPQENEVPVADAGSMDGLFEDLPISTDGEDDELSRAIAMSLEQLDGEPEQYSSTDELERNPRGPEAGQALHITGKNAKLGREFAHLMNAKAHNVAPKPSIVQNDDKDVTILQDASEESQPIKQTSKSKSNDFGLEESGLADLNIDQSGPTPSIKQPSPAEPPAFDGPLPFESLNLGKSILGKKKQRKVEEHAGGFENTTNQEIEKPPQPLPPWFSENTHITDSSSKALSGDRFAADSLDYTSNYEENRKILKRQETGEIIDLDGPASEINEVVDLETPDDKVDDATFTGEAVALDSDNETKVGDIPHLVSAEASKAELRPSLSREGDRLPMKQSNNGLRASRERAGSEEPIEWEESDAEAGRAKRDSSFPVDQPTGLNFQTESFEGISQDLKGEGLVGSPATSQFSKSQSIRAHKIPLSSTSNEDMVDDPSFDTLVVDDREDLYSDPEDADLMRQLAIEAEEHARFASTFNAKSQLQNAEDYERELRQLRNQQKRDRRDADEVTHIMITECQQLLRLFGLPYVTAPMEAEAQCAELVSLGLVDGIVTDDSDVFLFGGTRVYKNMFNQAKFVECYLASDLEKEYSLDRHKLIGIAHLLGSDYTEGLPSVGPVTALEILSEFPTLEDFAGWWSQLQMGGKLSAEDAANPFRRKFKRNASKLFLPPTFPDRRVDRAYMHPEVDNDPSPFAWGVPDLDALRSFLMATIGWSQERTDEVLVPVIKDMNRRENEGTQSNLTQFFTGSVGVGASGRATTTSSAGGANAFAPRRRVETKSKRMESALDRLQQQARGRSFPGTDDHQNRDQEQNQNQDITKLTLQKQAKPAQRKRKRKPKHPSPSDTASSNSNAGDGATNISDPKSRSPQTRKRPNAGTKGSKRKEN